MRLRRFAAVMTILGALGAVPAAAQPAFQGFYLGGYGAYSLYDADVTITGLGSADFDADGFGFGGFFGFGLRNQALYGGLEAEFGHDGAEEGSLFGTTVSLEARLSYGIAFRAGWVIEERYLPYLRIGWQRTDFEASAPGVGSQSEDLNALRVGVGLEALVTDRFSVRGEYAYTAYEDFEESIITVKPGQHLFRIAAAFHF